MGEYLEVLVRQGQQAVLDGSWRNRSLQVSLTGGQVTTNNGGKLLREDKKAHGTSMTGRTKTSRVQETSIAGPGKSYPDERRR